MRFVAVVLAMCLLLVSVAVVSAQQASADDRIYDQVRLKLASHPDVKGGAIEVKVNDGVVTLQGSVRTQKARDKAQGVAGKIKGVKKVINELKVNPA